MSAARRLTPFMALLAVWPSGGAVAHSCARPTRADVGQPVTINLGVPAETRAVVGVDVSIPDGLRLDDAEGPDGWSVEREGGRVRFSGGTVTPFGCEFFVLRGEPTRKGKLVLDMTTRHGDGSSTAFTSEKIDDLHGAHLVFAGVEPQASDYARGRSESGEGVGTYAVPAVGGLGLVGVLIVLQRLRRAEGPSGPARRPPPAPRTVRKKPASRRPGR